MLIHVLMILSTIPVGSRFQMEGEYNRRVKELANQGCPVSLENLEKQHKVPVGAKNAADLYIEAFLYYQEPNETEMEYLPVRGNYDWPDDVPPFPQEVMDAIEASLKKNRKTLHLLDRASFIDRCHWPGTLKGNHFSNAHLREIKKSLCLLSERNLYLAQKGKLNDLKWSTQSLLALSNSLSEQPFEVDFLVTIAMKAWVVRSFEIMLGQVAFIEKDLRLYQKQLHELQDPDLMRRATINERCGSIVYWKLPLSQQIFTVDEYIPMPDFKYFKILATLSGVKQKDKLFILDGFEDCIDALSMPLHQRYDVLHKIDEIHELASILNIYRLRLPLTAKLCRIHLRAIGGLRCAEIAMAIEQYRLKYKMLPETLDKLVPEFMMKIPLDPFDGQPLRYVRHEEGGYSVYSINEDGVDNGGLSEAQMREKNGGNKPDEYDWPFTVRR